MKNTIMALRGMPLLALSAALCIGAAAKPLSAGIPSSQTGPESQASATLIDEEEEKAYNAAKREKDYDKRAQKLYEFIQKYPESKLLERADYDNVQKLEEEHHAFYEARQEVDYEKRAAMLIAFVQQYPKSSLQQNAAFEYLKMLQDSSQAGKYELLESLAEKWLQIQPSVEIHGFLATAAGHLQKHDKNARSLEEIYRSKPEPTLAREILAVYQKTENVPKQVEWADTVFKMPEFADDYALRYSMVMKFSQDNDLQKAADYAQITLQSLERVKESTENLEQLRKIRRACHHVIGSNLMGKGQYAEAAASFKKALEAEKYSEGYYRIAVCLDNQKDVENADLYYAMAELMGGSEAARAKARLETLYKAIHNDTLIGIDKVYKKAKEMLAENGS